MATYTADDMLNALPTAMRTKAGTQTNWEFMQSVDEGLWAEWRTAMSAILPQLYRGTSTGGWLDNRLRDFGLAPGSSETDGQKLLRLRRRIVKLWGAVYPDNLLSMVGKLTGVDVTAVQMVENQTSTGAYAPATVTFRVPSSALLAAGIPAADIAATLQSLSTDLSAAAAAGVKVTVELFGGASYDSGDNYDDDALYGS